MTGLIGYLYQQYDVFWELRGENCSVGFKSDKRKLGVSELKIYGNHRLINLND